MSEPFSLQPPITILTYEALQLFIAHMARPIHPDDVPTDFNERPPERGWKEVKFELTEADRPGHVRHNCLDPAAYVFSEKIKQMKMQTFPFAVLPHWFDADPAARLEMAVATDPETGFSLRGRRWHSVDQNKDYIAFDIASEGYESPKGIPFVGTWMTA